MSALVKAICDSIRSIIIFAVGIAITFTIGTQQENYQLERMEIGSICCQILGFIFIMVGSITYNKIEQ
jgi:hypothetical protein